MRFRHINFPEPHGHGSPDEAIREALGGGLLSGIPTDGRTKILGQKILRCMRGPDYFNLVLENCVASCRLLNDTVTLDLFEHSTVQGDQHETWTFVFQDGRRVDFDIHKEMPCFAQSTLKDIYFGRTFLNIYLGDGRSWCLRHAFDLKTHEPLMFMGRLD
jgi:hypothetical protein